MPIGLGHFVLGLGLLVSPLFSQEEIAQQYTRKQLREMIGRAHTPEDHRQLAGYYRGQERSFRRLEAEQRQSLDQYNKAPQNSHSKYPTRGHSARHLASYYSQQAEKAAALAIGQERLAGKTKP